MPDYSKSLQQILASVTAIIPHLSLVRKNNIKPVKSKQPILGRAPDRNRLIPDEQPLL
jgi:hypothetical protein